MELLRKLPRALRKIGAKIPAKKNLNTYANPYLLKKAFHLSLSEKNQHLAKALEEDTIKTAPFIEWTEKHLADALEKSDGSLNEGLRIYDLLYNTLPDHFLTKVDRASMRSALEVRCPFLDVRLLEYSQKIPGEWKLDAQQTKKFMRELITGIVPDAILGRKKQGFTPPIEDWISDATYQPRIQAGLATLGAIDATLAEHYEHKYLIEEQKLYKLYIIRLFLFQLWWERWMH
jgi:asparagine synthase (glutamine-hydrolysing)